MPRLFLVISMRSSARPGGATCSVSSAPVPHPKSGRRLAAPRRWDRRAPMEDPPPRPAAMAERPEAAAPASPRRPPVPIRATAPTAPTRSRWPRRPHLLHPPRRPWTPAPDASPGRPVPSSTATTPSPASVTPCPVAPPSPVARCTSTSSTVLHPRRWRRARASRRVPAVSSPRPEGRRSPAFAGAVRTESSPPALPRTCPRPAPVPKGAADEARPRPCSLSSP